MQVTRPDPIFFTALAAFCVLLLHLWQQRGQPIAEYKYPKAAFWLFVGYVVVAVIGALVLPWVFEGQPLNYMLDPDRNPVKGSLLPLTFSLSNIVQAANLCIHAVVLVYLLQAAQRKEWRRSGPILGLTAALALALALGFYERIAHILSWPSSISFWASNPGYLQEHSSIIWGVKLLRIGVPFSEPSYLSVLMAAAMIGCLSILAFGRQRGWASLGTVLCGLGLFNTLGATGWAAASLGLLGVMVWLAWRAWRNPRLRKWTLLLWMCAALTVASVATIALHAPESSKITHSIKSQLTSRLDGDSWRQRSNEQAVTIIQKTAGLGVGLGSNRASSFLASLFSNTGILGGALFLAMLCALWRGYARARTLTDVQLFTAVALATAMLAMTLAIPDLNLPMFWAFIFLAFLYHPVLQKSTRQPEP